MVPLLVIIALLVSAGAALLMSQATMGVGAMAFACLCGILARIAQSSTQHRELVRLARSAPPTAQVCADEKSAIDSAN